MPNKKSAKKELRKAKKRSIANKKTSNTAKSLIKNSLKKINAEDKTVKDDVSKTVKAIDKAAQKGIIKKNTAARKKSRLMKKVNTLK